MRILVLELKDQDSPIFDKIMEVVKCCPDIEHIRIKDEPMLSLPGLEIYAKTGKYTGAGTFTIVEEADGKGASKWGLLKSYQEKRDGWISLDYGKRV